MNSSSLILGGGCFWCVEAVFKDLLGILEVCPGYGGGWVEHPSYESVCSETTGHAELVKLIFNPEEIGLEDIFRVFFTTHDPTQTDGQGPDKGTRYRSVIFGDANQQAVARKVLEEIKAEKIWPDPIVTEIKDSVVFWPAENYHHDYFARNSEQPYCAAIVAPKLAKFRKLYRDRLKSSP